MQIVLRKISGRFDAAIGSSSGSGLRVLPRAHAVTDALTSPLLLLVLGLAMLVAFAIAWLTTGHTFAPSGHSPMASLMFAPIAGSLKLKDLNDKLATKAQALHDVFDKAGSDNDFNKEEVKSLVGASNSAEVVEKVRAMNDELAALGKQRDDMIELDGIRDANTKRRNTPADRPAFQSPQSDEERERKQSKSIGRAIVESKAWQGFKNTQQPHSSTEEGFEVKTAFTTAAGWAPETTRVPGMLIDKATRPIQLLDIIPTAPTNQAAIVYMEETTRTHSAAERAENSTYAESAFAWTQRSVTVVSIGDSVPVTDEQLADVPQAEAYLNQRLGFGVDQRVDSQLINGDGTGSNLLGLLNKAGIQTQAKGADAVQDAFYKAQVKVRVTGRAVPSAHIMHPLDWQGVRLQRTADGIYIWGSPAEAGPERMWGLSVVQADSIAQGTGITADVVNFVQLFQRSGLEVAVGFVGSDFANGRKTVRAGKRLALVITRAAAICTVTGL